VNLTLSQDENTLPRFVDLGLMRSLVFDSRNHELELLASKIKKVDDTLLVHDNTPLDVKAVALLAAINTVIERKQIPQGVQSAFDLLQLEENLKLFAEVRSLIDRAA